MKEVKEIDIGNIIAINANDTIYDSCSKFSYPLKEHYLILINNCEISIHSFKILRFESRYIVITPNLNMLPKNVTLELPTINLITWKK